MVAIYFSKCKHRAYGKWPSVTSRLVIGIFVLPLLHTRKKVFFLLYIAEIGTTRNDKSTLLLLKSIAHRRLKGQPNLRDLSARGDRASTSLDSQHTRLS